MKFISVIAMALLAAVVSAAPVSDTFDLSSISSGAEKAQIGGINLMKRKHDKVKKGKNKSDNLNLDLEDNSNTVVSNQEDKSKNVSYNREEYNDTTNKSKTDNRKNVKNSKDNNSENTNNGSMDNSYKADNKKTLTQIIGLTPPGGGFNILSGNNILSSSKSATTINQNGYQ
ncbi:hypothetical protein BDB01DRAFT_905733 [Pilobolus umbonatus]|nr:hypothetical protein BDB01DRAFT_905733 [Pilobolus umbonatus]